MAPNDHRAKNKDLLEPLLGSNQRWHDHVQGGSRHHGATPVHHHHVAIRVDGVDVDSVLVGGAAEDADDPETIRPPPMESVAQGDSEQDVSEPSLKKCSTWANLLIFSIAELIGGFTFSLLSPFYTKEATEKGLSVTQTGLVRSLQIKILTKRITVSLHNTGLWLCFHHDNHFFADLWKIHCQDWIQEHVLIWDFYRRCHQRFVRVLAMG